MEDEVKCWLKKRKEHNKYYFNIAPSTSIKFTLPKFFQIRIYEGVLEGEKQQASQSFLADTSNYVA